MTEQDYQTFAFEILVRNDVKGLEFQCPIIDGICSCPFASTIQSATNCAVAGNDLLVVRRPPFVLFRKLLILRLRSTESGLCWRERWIVCWYSDHHHRRVSTRDVGSARLEEKVISVFLILCNCTVKYQVFDQSRHVRLLFSRRTLSRNFVAHSQPRKVNPEISRNLARFFRYFGQISTGSFCDDGDRIRGGGRARQGAGGRIDNK